MKYQPKRDQYVFVLSLFALLALALDYGYPESHWDHLLTDIYYLLYSILFLGNLIPIAKLKSFMSGHKREVSRGLVFVMAISAVLVVIALANTVFFMLWDNKLLNFPTTVLVFLISMFDLSARVYAIERQTLHPALAFVLSFVILIFLGTLLLMLPKATVNGIDFVDALFTATSAVCVTGLAVLDTGKDFTNMGQFFILILIQFGALGMLSFTSLFGLMFKGFGSYENRLALKSLINAETLESTFKTLIQIIIFVFSAELAGAFFIYFFVDFDFGSVRDKIFFSLFHSISAFCNAGFSTLSGSLYEQGYRHDYNLHLVIAVLIILGGIGYGVIINLYQYGKKSVKYYMFRLLKISFRETERIKPTISLNSKIVLVTTVVLIVAGGVLFWLLEEGNTMSDYSTWGKIVTAFFGSVTTRTAGFNTVDMGQLTLPTLMIVLLFMWIGASPGSTGGGIKTTTFAVATLNIVQEAFGFRHIRVGWKKIERGALNRATSIISLSLIMIGGSTFLLVLFDGDLGIMPLAFESFSAYSTVGLSMGITAGLGVSSKVVLILTMLIGRVGFLTLLSGVARQFYKHRYSAMGYPEEKIFIN